MPFSSRKETTIKTRFPLQQDVKYDQKRLELCVAISSHCQVLVGQGKRAGKTYSPALMVQRLSFLGAEKNPAGYELASEIVRSGLPAGGHLTSHTWVESSWHAGKMFVF